MVAEARATSTASIDAELVLAGEERGRLSARCQSLAGYEAASRRRPASTDLPETPIVHLAGQVLSIEATPEADLTPSPATTIHARPSPTADRH